MIGQVRFAWINFKRSILTSVFSSVGLIVTYSAIVFSIAMYSIVDPYLYWSISNTYYKSYSWMGIVFVIVSIIIGGVVTTRSIDLKFQNQKDDIAIMKNVGGKNKWIYSYFIFNQIITSIIMLILGVILALIILAIVFFSANFGFLLENVKFIPVLGANIGILLIAYLKSHYTILKFISEKNFEVSSGKLSNYKSIFEFNGIISKLKTTSKLATKNYIRSGKIIASLLFSFFLAFSIISFALGPVSINETYVHQMNNRFNDATYVIGQDNMIDYYGVNLGAQPYSNSSFTGNSTGDIEFFNSLAINSSLIDDLQNNGIEFQEYIITKLLVREITGLWVDDSGYPVSIGDNRTFYATVIGCKVFPIYENIIIWGEEPNNGEVIIGESLDTAMFEESSVQKIKITEESNNYDISGVIRDTFCAGFSVYISFNQLKSEISAPGSNLITLGELNSTELSIVSGILEDYGYTMERMDQLLKENMGEYIAFSSVYGILGGLLFLIFSLQIIIFAFLYVLSYRSDYELLYKLGISKRKISRISARSILLQIIPGTIFGTYFGSIITRYFLVPYTRLSYYLAFLFGIMIWFILIAYIGAKMASRRQIKQVYDKVYLNKVMRY